MAVQLLHDQCATTDEEQQLTSKQRFQQCSLVEGESIQAFNNRFNKLLRTALLPTFASPIAHNFQHTFVLYVTIHLCMLSSNSNPLKANLNKANLSLYLKHRATCKGMKKSSFPLSARYPLNNQNTRVLPHHLIERKVIKREISGTVKKEVKRHLPILCPLRRKMVQT